MLVNAGKYNMDCMGLVNFTGFCNVLRVQSRSMPPSCCTPPMPSTKTSTKRCGTTTEARSRSAVSIVRLLFFGLTADRTDRYFKYLRLFFESMDALPKQKRRWPEILVEMVRLSVNIFGHKQPINSVFSAFICLVLVHKSSFG